MLVNLYYIEGISRTDTPYYATKGSQATLAKQEAFFTSKLIKSIQQSYYPPHYRNVIKFDSEDLDINTNVNYISLEYQNKTYYYFIDSIEYVSENILALNITMDVVQTYMFDIRVSNSIIERKFINRWNETDYLTINRNYIRENYSKGFFKTVSYDRVDNPKNYTIVCTWSREKLNANAALTQEMILSREDGDDIVPIANTAKTPISAVPTFFPLNSQRSDFPSYLLLQTVVTAWNFNSSILTHNVGVEPEAFDMFVIPFEPVCSFYYNDAGLVRVKSKTVNGKTTYYAGVSIGTSMGGQEIDGVFYAGAIVCFERWLEGSTTEPLEDCNLDIPIKLHTNEIELFNNGNINRSIGVFYSSRFMPVMIDSNYVQYECGTNSCNTTFPLEYAERNEIYFHYYANVNDGTRTYLLNLNPNTVQDVYSTSVLDTSKIQVEMDNDPWKEYNATNKFRWLETAGKAAVTISTAFVTKGASLSVLAAEKAALLARKDSYTPKRGLLSKKTQRKLMTIEGEETTDKAAMAAAGIAAVGTFANQAASDMNVYYSPMSLKVSGSLPECFGDAVKIHIKKNIVTDYEQVAQFYHRSGYLVNEHTNYISNIFEYIQNRYYFNVLKVSDVDLHLADIIEDVETIDLIKERLTDGIRLWNVDDNIRYPEVTRNNIFSGDTYINVGIIGVDNMYQYTFEVDLTQYASIIDKQVSVNLAYYGYLPNITNVDIISSQVTDLGNNKYKVVIVSPTVITLPQLQSSDFHTSLKIIGKDTSQPIRDVKIGDFSYDNVELDYIQ